MKTTKCVRFAKAAFAAVALMCAVVVATPSSAFAEAVTFAYQGKVKVGGQPFSGNGAFKLSIVNSAGTLTLWSHDGTGQDGQEPTGTPLSIPVSEGIFNITVGDPATGQQALSPTIFADKQALKLRVWFNGGSGFQQLLPDQNLSNLSLTVLETGSSDFTIYVDGATGDNTNNGLTTETAKKSIQAAIDAVPERLHCNVTIDVADGIYREQLDLHGFTTDVNKELLILGDEDWTPTSATAPRVVVSGADESGAAVRYYNIYATQCSNVVFKGLHLQTSKWAGAELRNGEYTVRNCMVSDARTFGGYDVTRQADVSFKDCLATDNKQAGFRIANSTAAMAGCASRANHGDGVLVQGQSQLNFNGSGDVSNNDNTGFQVWSSALGFTTPCNLTVNNNGQGAFVLWYMAQMTWYQWNRDRGYIQVTGNGGSIGNTYQINCGSQAWW